MDFELTTVQKKLEQEIDQYLDDLVTPEYEEEKLRHPEGGGPEEAPEFCKVVRQLGKDGWLGIGWPKEYGGQDRSHIEQYIFFDYVYGKYRISIPMLTLNSVGPTIMQVGTEEQKRKYLPRILAGELNVGGYLDHVLESSLDSCFAHDRAVRQDQDRVVGIVCHDLGDVPALERCHVIVKNRLVERAIEIASFSRPRVAWRPAATTV